MSMNLLDRRVSLPWVSVLLVLLPAFFKLKFRLALELDGVFCSISLRRASGDLATITRSFFSPKSLFFCSSLSAGEPMLPKVRKNKTELKIQQGLILFSFIVNNSVLQAVRIDNYPYLIRYLTHANKTIKLQR